MKNYLEIAVVDPWYDAVNEEADVFAFYGVVGHLEVGEDVVTDGYLLPDICRAKQR